MKCVICKHGELKPGVTSLLFEKNNSTIVIKGVPVDRCDNCGEIYVPDKTAEQIMSLLESVESQGIIVDVRNFSSEISATC
jgi:YgiT-type zinc finger domain-containing protein